MVFGPRSRGHLVVGLPRDAFRPSLIFLCTVALFGVSGWMLWTEFGNVRIDALLFVIAGWIVSLCLHEYAHAVFAYRAGDIGVVERGYLTLNPLKYTHPLLSIVFPVLIILIGGIGLPGGAIWVDRHYVRSRLADSLISFAGPAANVLFTIALVVPFALGVDTFSHLKFWAAVAFLAFLQLTASILNFMPIPGVDGGNLIKPWLNYQWRRGFEHVQPYGMLLLFGLLMTPKFNQLFFKAVFFVGDLIGLPQGLYGYGYDLIRFWSF
jgi:Zn-dependent protease